ncbi:MAG: DUF938 domain-containing protein [Alphaproteobacteria bacterium]
MPNENARLYAPATARNKEPILGVLRQVLPPQGLVLEIASGTGEHAAHFAANLPGLVFQPSDANGANLASIASWTAGLANVAAPIVLDVHRQPWSAAHVDALVCINMIHISPWSAAVALFEGAAAALPPAAPLVLYGPFKRDGRHTAPSNAEFDESLRARDPSWGVRDLGEVADLAASKSFGAPEIYALPANNLALVFVRAG